MTEPLERPQEPTSLDEVLQSRARTGAGVATEAGEQRLLRPSPRLGQVLRIATLVADAGAATGAVALLGVVEGPLALLVVPALAVAWLMLLRAWGAYRRGLAYPLASEAKSVALAGLIGALLLLQLGPLAGLETTRSTPVALAAPIVFLSLGRLALRIAGGALRKRRALVRRVLLVGDGPDAYELLENIEAWPGLGVEVVGVCADTKKGSVWGLPVLGLTRSSALVARDLGIGTVVLAPAALSADECSKLHGALLDAGLEVVLTPNVAQVEASRLSARQFGGLPVLRLQQREEGPRYLGKRVFDLLVSGALLFVLAPLFVAIAAVTRCDSQGPAFFRQRRIGRNGVPFELWKFRTMSIDAESLLEDLRLAGATPSRNGLFKLQDDPRVTRVGRWLRRTSLDELPQLWNVLLGEMSVVGPRPALPEEVAEFDDFTLRRLRVKPGITGLWQVSGRSDASFATYSRMDAFYAENWTLLGDLKILCRTVPVVLRSKGAY